MSDRILLLEDEPKLAKLMESELGFEGYHVTVAPNGLDGLTSARDAQSDLLILDWMLPGVSGLDICLRLRSTAVQVPIIMLTAKDKVPDRVTGLNAGADHYVTKPFCMEKLLARVKAPLRRTQPNDTAQLQFEDLILNGLTREVYRGSQLIELTAKEFNLL